MNRNILMPIMISMTRFYHNSKLLYRYISVLFHNSNLFFITAFILLLFYITSCAEKPTIIGSDLLPGKDFVNIKSTDTIGVGAYNLYTDSVMTNGRTYSYMGRLHDPYFGDTRTDFVTQLRLSQKWAGIGSPPVVDSVKLFFSINGAKGTIDSTVLHQFKMYEITEDLNSAVGYYSNRDPNVGMEIGTFDLAPVSKDTIKAMVVTLPNSFGEYLLRDTSKLEQEGDANDFRSFFKGLYFTMIDSPSPFLVAFTFTNSDFFIRVYYDNYQASGLYYDFIINTNSIRYNRYLHDFSTGTAASRIKPDKFGKTDSMIYLQAFDGVYPQLRMPGLSYIKDNLLPVSVNRARLTFSVFLDSANFNSTTVPPLILMKYKQTDTTIYIVPDYQVSSSFYDGTFNSTNNTYSFNLASFAQEYLEGRIADPTIEMYFPEGEYRNVILKANNSHFPVKFNFTYTKF
jgi:Domain of unknown function (DUF4270)